LALLLSPCPLSPLLLPSTCFAATRRCLIFTKCNNLLVKCMCVLLGNLVVQDEARVGKELSLLVGYAWRLGVHHFNRLSRLRLFQKNHWLESCNFARLLIKLQRNLLGHFFLRLQNPKVATIQDLIPISLVSVWESVPHSVGVKQFPVLGGLLQCDACSLPWRLQSWTIMRRCPLRRRL